jgi:hypothetical protein
VIPRDDPSLLAWFELCPPCEAAFYRWRDAPNPGAWTNPKIQANPYLLGFLGACRAAGPSPEAWRETVSWQLLLIRRICTEQHNLASLGYGYEGRVLDYQRSPASWPLDLAMLPQPRIVSVVPSL